MEPAKAKKSSYGLVVALLFVLVLLASLPVGYKAFTEKVPSPAQFNETHSASEAPNK